MKTNPRSQKHADSRVARTTENSNSARCDPDQVEQEFAETLRLAAYVFEKEENGRFQGSILACRVVARRPRAPHREGVPDAGAPEPAQGHDAHQGNVSQQSLRRHGRANQGRMQGIESARISHRVRQPFCNRPAGCTAHRRSVVGSFASKAAEAVRPCTSAALPKADVNSTRWPPPLCARALNRYAIASGPPGFAASIISRGEIVGSGAGALSCIRSAILRASSALRERIERWGAHVRKILTDASSDRRNSIRRVA
jgi:hypothetical protein